jgi:hypothetical protein
MSRILVCVDNKGSKLLSIKYILCFNSDLPHTPTKIQ